MPIQNIVQPEVIQIDETLRLRKYDGIHDFALEWYQDEETLMLVDGANEPYDLDRLGRMYRYLDAHGELYFIEVNVGGNYEPIGDVTFWQNDMPIVIGKSQYRGKGIGRKVIAKLAQRARILGYDKIYVNEIYSYNIGSMKAFESVGFKEYEKTEKGARYYLELGSTIMNYQIIHLPKEKWQNQIIPIDYTTTQYYDVVIDQKPTGFAVNIELKDFDKPVTHNGEEYDFPDKLYQEFWPGACAWGVVDGERLVAAIETCPEEWSNRLRITELWVDPAWQKKGVGHALMEVAKEQARLENRRAIMLETQSCNVNAIGFYLHEGFTLMGLDTCCYNNKDLERKEVRIELAWFPKRTALKRENVEIRQERPEEYHAVEAMVRDAFWNKFRQGCDEHLLVHKLRNSEVYLPELSRILLVDGEIAGAICFAKAWVDDGIQKHEVLSFGPLAVAPKWKGCGVGAMLMEETHKLAKEAGYPAIIITGVPTYYPRVGYKPAGDFGLTVDGGKTFPAFMAYELYEGALNGIQGEFHEAEVFFNLPAEELEVFDKKFEKKNKLYFPKQW